MYVKDGILYRAMYCGLCKSLGGCCGQRSRLALSYDMTFLSLLLHNIKNTDVKIEQRRCALHPFVRRPVTADDGLTSMLACLNTALTYHKLCDDVEDEHKGRAARALFRGAYRRAEEKHPQACALMQERMAALSELEQENCSSPDMAADPFASMMADLTDYCLGEFATEDTRALAYGIGKWVYLIDALDDYEKDVKKGSYNPFSSREQDDALRSEVKDMLTLAASGAAQELEMLPLDENLSILRNVVYSGIWSRFEGKRSR